MSITSIRSSTILTLVGALASCQGWFPERPNDADIVDASDADWDIERDTDVDGDSTSDADTEQERTVQELLISMQSCLRENCVCFWESLGYASPEDCLETSLFDELYTICYIESYATHESLLEHSTNCVVRAWETTADCFEGAECDESEHAHCTRELDVLLEGCPEVTDLTQALFERDRQQCVMGEPSGCPDDDAVSSDIGDVVFFGTNQQMGDDMSPMCMDEFQPGADVSFSWSAPVDGTYLFDTLGSDFDTVLYLQTSCDGRELGCNDDFDEEGNTFSLVEVLLEESSPVVVVVDAASADERGNFVVNIILAE